MQSDNASEPRLRAWHSPAAAIVAAHNVAEKLTSLTLGRVVVSPLADRLRERQWSHWAAPSLPRVRAAIVAHAYYPELVSEILRCHRWLPEGSPLHLTTTADRLDNVTRAVGKLSNIYIHIVPNRGRDIAPFLHVLSSGQLDEYDAVLKLHTKRSPHLLDGNIRRLLFYLALAGGPAKVHRIVSLFEAETTGIVGWAPSLRTGQYYWQRNERSGREIIARMGGLADTPLVFFEGSMFWFRPVALRRLRTIGFQVEDFEDESNQTDGALHHAIERMFCIAARLDGFDVRSTRGRLLLGPSCAKGTAAASHSRSAPAMSWRLLRRSRRSGTTTSTG